MEYQNPSHSVAGMATERSLTMLSFYLTDNLTRSGLFAPFGKVARLAIDIILLGWYPDSRIVGWECSDNETHNVGRVLIASAETAAKPDKEGVLRVKVPTQQEDGTVDLQWMPLDTLRDKIEEAYDKIGSSFAVADGRTRAMAVFLANVLSFEVEPRVRTIDPEESKEAATWAAEANRHVWNNSRADRLHNALESYVSEDPQKWSGKPEWTEAGFRRCMKVERGTGQLLYGQVRLIHDKGLDAEDVSSLTAAECRKVLDAGADHHVEALGKVLAEKANKGNKPKPITPAKLAGIMDESNDLFKVILGMVLNGEEAALRGLATMSSGHCLERLGVIIAQAQKKED
jgi:hypothetical protein